MKDKQTRTARRGRIFPEIQWTEEQKAQKSFIWRLKPQLHKQNPPARVIN